MIKNIINYILSILISCAITAVSVSFIISCFVSLSPNRTVSTFFGELMVFSFWSFVLLMIWALLTVAPLLCLPNPFQHLILKAVIWVFLYILLAAVMGLNLFDGSFEGTSNLILACVYSLVFWIVYMHLTVDSIEAVEQTPEDMPGES